MAQAQGGDLRWPSAHNEAPSHPVGRRLQKGLCPFHLSRRGQGWGRGLGLDTKYSYKLSASFYFTRTRCIKVPGKTEAKGYKNRSLPSGTMRFYWPACQCCSAHMLKSLETYCRTREVSPARNSRTTERVTDSVCEPNTEGSQGSLPRGHLCSLAAHLHLEFPTVSPVSL